MKKIISLILIAIACTTSVKIEKSLPLLKISENQRFLMTEKGEPFFWLGDTGWLLFSKLNRNEAEQYLDNRKQKGFNVIQVMVLHSLNITNVYGDSALVNKNVAIPKLTEGNSFENSAEYDYWDHVDYIIDLAEKKGIYMALVPVWGSNVRSGKVSKEEAKSYAIWLAKRYSHKTNIIWLNGGDTQGNLNTEIWDIIGQQIKTNAPNHLITFHPYGRTNSAWWFNDREWLDFNMFQSGHRRYDQDDTEHNYGEDNWRHIKHTFDLKPTKPIFDGEPSYEGIPQGLHDPVEPYWEDKDVRRYAYWSVFAGGCGFTYGNNAVMQFHKPDNPNPAYGVRELWTEAIDAEGANQLIHLKDLILSKPYFERKPAQSLLVENGERYDYQIATRSENYAMIYTYNGREINVDMDKINAKNISASWFNPRNGEITLINNYNISGILNFNPPGEIKNGNDWVLIIETNNSN